MSDDLPQAAARRGGSSPRPIARAIPRLTRAALARRGFHAPRLLADWTEVVGPMLAEHTLPEKLTGTDRPGGGTLTLRVASAMAPEVQHWEPQIVERVNAVFGFRAVTRLRLLQGPIPRRPQPSPPPPPLDPAEQRVIAAQVAPVADSDLRQALAGLAEGVRRRARLEKAT